MNEVSKTAVFASTQKKCGKSYLADNLAWSLERTKTRFSFDAVPRGCTGCAHGTQLQRDAVVRICDIDGRADPAATKDALEHADLFVLPFVENEHGAEDVFMWITQMVRKFRRSNLMAKVVLALNRYTLNDFWADADEWLAYNAFPAVVTRVPYVPVKECREWDSPILKPVNIIREALGLERDTPPRPARSASKKTTAFRSRRGKKN